MAKHSTFVVQDANSHEHSLYWQSEHEELELQAPVPKQFTKTHA
jgi:hypothetical protein